MDTSPDFWEKVIMENRDELSVEVAAVSIGNRPSLTKSVDTPCDLVYVDLCPIAYS